MVNEDVRAASTVFEAPTMGCAGKNILLSCDSRPANGRF